MPTNIKALLVDDEISALNTLRGMLTMYCPWVQIVGEAASVSEATHAVAALKPDLVFLDIEMPPSGTAFDFLRHMRPGEFGIIFTTAYEQYAVKAMNAGHHAWYYLVKPYSVANLLEALHVAEERLRDRQRVVESQQADHQGLTVADSKKRNIVVRFRDILYCEADNSTTDIYVQRRDKPEKFTVYRSLRDLESELPEAMFCRTHNSYIVNMARVDHYERTGRNGIIHLDNGEQVGISVERLKYFMQRFEDFLGR